MLKVFGGIRALTLLTAKFLLPREAMMMELSRVIPESKNQKINIFIIACKVLVCVVVRKHYRGMHSL